MRFRIVSPLAVATLFLVCASVHAQPAPEPATQVTPKQLVTAKRFMVVAANPLAARAGYDVLKRGGSAVDAAIATELVNSGCVGRVREKHFPISPDTTRC